MASVISRTSPPDLIARSADASNFHAARGLEVRADGPAVRGVSFLVER
jgi:hypothetical protein